MLGQWLKSAIKFISEIVKKNRKSPLFKPIAFLVAMVILTLGYQFYLDIKSELLSDNYSYSESTATDEKSESDENETDNTEDDEKILGWGIDLPLGIHIGGFSIFLFLSFVAALAVVEFKKKQRLKSSDEERWK